MIQLEDVRKGTKEIPSLILRSAKNKSNYLINDKTCIITKSFIILISVKM